MEIKPSELRVGNILHEGMVYQIHDDRFYIKDKDGLSLKNKWAVITPEPLTEEWLLKFGFIESKDNHPFLSLKYFYIAFSGTEWVVKQVLSVPFACATIKYVHQLQNIYFALTGEELTLKIKP